MKLKKIILACCVFASAFFGFSKSGSWGINVAFLGDHSALGYEDKSDKVYDISCTQIQVMAAPPFLTLSENEKGKFYGEFLVDIDIYSFDSSKTTIDASATGTKFGFGLNYISNPQKTVSGGIGFFMKFGTIFGELSSASRSLDFDGTTIDFGLKPQLNFGSNKFKFSVGTNLVLRSYNASGDYMGDWSNSYTWTNLTCGIRYDYN